MTGQEILAGLAPVIADVACLPDASAVTLDQEFAALEVDSLSMAEIAVAAQDAFGVEVPDDALRELGSVQDIVTYISERA